MTSSQARVFCYGEILWDVFPDQRLIGGAPLNVASRLHSLGADVHMISALGKDALGEEALNYLNEVGLSTEEVASVDRWETGSVIVTLDDAGSASYEIKKPVAWDFIGVSRELLSSLGLTDYVVFGSLSLRGAFNREVMQALMQTPAKFVFDVNLRPPHYDLNMVYELMQRSDVVKMNDDELEAIAQTLGGPADDMKEQVLWLEKTTNTHKICITRGADGALLRSQGEFYEHPGYSVTVADTVGAGDSFLACLIQGWLLAGLPPQKALAQACAMGALVASKSGANATVLLEELEHLMSS